MITYCSSHGISYLIERWSNDRVCSLDPIREDEAASTYEKYGSVLHFRLACSNRIFYQLLDHTFRPVDRL